MKKNLRVTNVIKVDRPIMGRPVQRIRPAGHFRPLIKYGWWRRVLTQAERIAYARLRQVAHGNQRLGQVAMLEALGGGHARKLRPLFEALAAYGFIECRRWGKVIPMDVLVNEVPEPPDNPKLAARLEAERERRPSEPSETRDFVLWFTEEWERRSMGANKKTRYPLNFARDFSVGARLLARHEPSILRKYAIHWFLRMEPPHVLTSFAGRIESVIQHYNQARAEYEAMLDLPPVPVRKRAIRK